MSIYYVELLRFNLKGTDIFDSMLVTTVIFTTKFIVEISYFVKVCF